MSAGLTVRDLPVADRPRETVSLKARGVIA